MHAFEPCYMLLSIFLRQSAHLLLTWHALTKAPFFKKILSYPSTYEISWQTNMLQGKICSQIRAGSTWVLIQSYQFFTEPKSITQIQLKSYNLMPCPTHWSTAKSRTINRVNSLSCLLSGGEQFWISQEKWLHLRSKTKTQNDTVDAVWQSIVESWRNRCQILQRENEIRLGFGTLVVEC